MASGDTLFILEPNNSYPLDPNATVAQALYFSRSGWVTLAFPSGSGEDAAAEWSIVMPSEYSGSGVTASLFWTGATGVSANQVHWELTFENVTASSIDSMSFAVGATTSVDDDYNVSGAGVPQETVFTVANGAAMDGVVAGDIFRIRLLRDPDDASDDYAGDAQMLKMVFQET